MLDGIPSSLHFQPHRLSKHTSPLPSPRAASERHIMFTHWWTPQRLTKRSSKYYTVRLCFSTVHVPSGSCARGGTRGFTCCLAIAGPRTLDHLASSKVYSVAHSIHPYIQPISQCSSQEHGNDSEWMGLRAENCSVQIHPPIILLLSVHRRGIMLRAARSA
jgi:hypothetical protein